MNPQYTVKGSCLVQCPGMDEPNERDYSGWGDYLHDIGLYNEYMASFKPITLPCPAKPDSWKEDDVKELGRDFEIKEVATEMPCPYCSGNGYTASHDIGCYGSVSYCYSHCPVKLPCQYCGTMGTVEDMSQVIAVPIVKEKYESGIYSAMTEAGKDDMQERYGAIPLPAVPIVAERKGEVKNKSVEIKIDRSTLPKDGEHIRFKDDKEEWHEGYFVAGDDIFHVTDDKFFFAWYVHEWVSLDNSILPTLSGEVVIEQLYDAFCNWYHDDGSYDEFLKSEAFKAIKQYALSLPAKPDSWKEGGVKVEGVDFRMQYQWYYWDGGWIDCSKESYEAATPNSRRTIAVPIVTPELEHPEEGAAYLQSLPASTEGKDEIDEQLINHDFRDIISHALLGCDTSDVDKETWDLVFSECTKYVVKLIAAQSLRQSQPGSAEGEDAVEFVEWIEDSSWIWNFHTRLWWNMADTSIGSITTRQLYTLFTQTKNK